jgi:membrane-bound lytic murein transglycosylase D
MKAIFREEGMPEDLVYMALIESSFKSNAYSRARAKGFWQFIAGTAKRYDLKMDWWVDERSDFERSTRAAARYLKWLYGMFDNWYLAMAAYNAGENKIAYGIRYTGATNFWDLARTRYIRQETKNYVPAILAGMIIAKDPLKYGFTETLEEPIQYDSVPIDYTVDLRLVAECSGVSLEEIKQLNPELVRMTTPARSGYELRVPAGKKETFLAEISSIPEEKRITWRKHEVKPGETLSSIAAIYRTSATSISAANSFQSEMTLTPGQKVVIPIGRSSVSFPPTSTASSGGTTYRVRKGDTLFRIAAKNGTSVDRICELNGISSRHSLRVGERLIVRSGSSSRTSSKSSSSKKVASTSSSKNKKIIYQVKRGDTLFAIASSFNTDVSSIKKWNGLANHSIHPGDSLTIYTK